MIVHPLHVSPARLVAAESLLMSLGIAREGGLPLLTTCPRCQRRKLLIARDLVLGGLWSSCSGCHLAGDSIELAGFVWGLAPGPALKKLISIQLLPDHADILLQHTEHLAARTAALDFWQSCQTPPSSHDTSDLEGPLRRFGLLMAASHGGMVSWAEGLGRFIGFSDRAVVESALRAPGSPKLFPGTNWSRVMVIPFWDHPGRIRSFLLVGRDGDAVAGDWVFKRLSSGPGSDAEASAEAGLAFLPALGRAGLTGRASLIVPDVTSVCWLQARHLEESPDILPLAASWESPTLRTRTSLESTRKRGPVYLWGADAACFRQARRIGAQIAPERFTIGAVDRVRRKPLTIIEAALPLVASWENALESACKAVGDEEAEELVLDIGLSPAELRQFVAGASTPIRGRLAELVQSQGSRRSVAAANRVVVEDHGCWWIAKRGRPDELISDAIIRIDRVLQTPGRTVHEGRILFKEHETTFRGGAEFVRDPLGFARDRLLESGAGVATVATGWTRHALAIAQQFHSPSLSRGYSRIGWSREKNAFVWPHSILETGGRILEHADFDAVGRYPCQSVATDEEPSDLDFRILKDTAIGGCILAVAGFFVADALNMQAGRPRRRLALVGGGTIQAGRIAALDCGALEAAPKLASQLSKNHNWPVVIDRKLSGESLYATEPGSIVPVDAWTAAVLTTNGDWDSLEIAGNPPIPSGVTARVAFGHLIDLARRQFVLKTQRTIAGVLADQQSWLDTIGAARNLPDPKLWLSGYDEGVCLVSLLNKLISTGRLTGHGLHPFTVSAPTAIGDLGFGKLGVDPVAINAALVRLRAPEIDIDRITDRLLNEGALLEPAPEYPWVFAESWWKSRMTNPAGALNVNKHRRIAR